MSDIRSILILYGSQSGNSEDIAMQAGNMSMKLNLDPTVRAMDEISITDLQGQKRVLICCSTWGDGEQPDNAEDLWEEASNSSIDSLDGLNFSVLALGDSSYDLFCESGKEWDKWLESKGAKRIHERVDCDVDYEEKAQAWSEAVLRKMSEVEDDLNVIETDNKPEIIIQEANLLPIKEKKSDKKGQWSAKNPYISKLTQNYILNGEGSGKETRHIVFDLGDSKLEYKAGDALGVIPICPPEIVDELLSICGFNGTEEVETNLGICSIKEALSSRYEIHRVSKKWINMLGTHVKDNSESVDFKIIKRQRISELSGDLVINWEGTGIGEDLPPGYNEIGSISNPSFDLWNELTSDDSAMEDYMWTRDYIDALGDFNDIIFTPQGLIDGMDRLKPRLYSIASSPEFESGTVHLTVGIVRYNYHNRNKAGLTTGYLSDRCKVDETPIGVFMSPTRSFILPEDGNKDCIMVGPGTGIAPFRAFLQQRDLNKDEGRNWLFFGDWTEDGEYYYREEMDDWKNRGVLDNHDLAWSRDGEEKVYVQHLMEKNGLEIWQWINDGGYFYVCGDKSRMAKDVHKTLIKICHEHGDMTEQEATIYVETTLMKTEKRYLRDVY
ncbi:MAG: sulfite reductase flavoprotein subunit alpha [Euryarchaeota archaeon]|nr:sulfite reductase flavoprotein subunit alpha [Euryarchaeota archaeon]MBT5613884.1 sulfite reductase flavoprotein subunit alpha [Euryarchaeota archaeon]MBT7413501.1 sulfite reductase flavoprotein subunit alpha [Euryarchaeota archaeon]